ncbi:hypothetical protein CK203_109824 [Vitis vinifera]|uniref:Uncharacterized protein n=1 Tax=Vitis vinifera TaxID=29760 RepID=A0A438CFL4_VITVI|nr:hypothetical protein CK203_109824 [Vitis vinifera]
MTEKLLPMIQGLSDFRWLDPSKRPIYKNRSKKCAFHKDHGHTTETCRSLQYLVERLIKAGHLKQYLRSDTGGRDASQHHNSEAPSLAGLENPDESYPIQRIINNILRTFILPGSSWTSHLNVQFSVVQELSPFNSSWTHMASLHESHPFPYHQMVSFLTNEGQTDLYGSQLAARQCYQIAREAVANQRDASPPEPSIAHDQ